MNPVKESILVADAGQTDLASLLQLISGLSRNHYLAQALDVSGNVLGEIEVKGGMVLSARVQDLQGKEAVYALLSLSPHELEAFHVTDAPLPHEPIGFLQTLLLDGLRVQDELHQDPPALDADTPFKDWTLFDTATDQDTSPTTPPAGCPFSSDPAAAVTPKPPEDDLVHTATALRNEIYGKQPPYRAVPHPSPSATLRPTWVLLAFASLLALLWARKRS